jgi:hypothetical protein
MKTGNELSQDLAEAAPDSATGAVDFKPLPISLPYSTYFQLSDDQLHFCFTEKIFPAIVILPARPVGPGLVATE